MLCITRQVGETITLTHRITGRMVLIHLMDRDKDSRGGILIKLDFLVDDIEVSLGIDHRVSFQMDGDDDRPVQIFNLGPRGTFAESRIGINALSYIEVTRPEYQSPAQKQKAGAAG